MGPDIRLTMNLLSEVIVNRPPPLREFDQIYMRAGDMLVHVEHVAHWFDEQDLLFVGDGDAIGLAIMHLYKAAQLSRGPRKIHILDFDERVVGSVQRFARRFDLEDCVTASFYNICDPIPPEIAGSFTAFHINPPYGKSNGGRSIDVFLQRAAEAVVGECRGCIVLADDDSAPWTQEVLQNVQQSVVASGFVISGLRPLAHQYHLDDAPDLFSCTMLMKMGQLRKAPLKSFKLPIEHRDNFYGKNQGINVYRVKDKTAAGRFPSRDHEIELLDEDPKLWE